MASHKITVRQRVTIPLGIKEAIAEFITFNGFLDGKEHFALCVNPHLIEGLPLVRVHSECVTGDVFQSLRCDCGPQLNEAIERMTECGGYIIYLRQEGRGIGLNAKLDAYKLQDEGLDTFEANVRLGHAADPRSFEAAGAMLLALGLGAIHLITNNPLKVREIREAGIAVVKALPTGVHLNEFNRRYLESKVAFAGHNIEFVPQTRRTVS